MSLPTSIVLPPAKERQYIVFSCPEMDWLREDLFAKKPDWFVPGRVDWGTFPDGSPNLFIRDIEKIKNRHVLFLASHHSYQAKDHQFNVIYVLTRSKIRSLTISLPYLNTATMERVVREGEVATADVDAHRFNTLPSVGSPIELIMYDLHTLQNRFYFRNSVVATLATGIGLLRRRLEALPGIEREKLCIAFPDDGASKRFGHHFEDYPQIVCKKVRDGDHRYVTVSSGDLRGAHVIIVDDLVQSGGTLIECHKGLKGAGASKVSAYVTHAIFPNKSWEKFLGTSTSPSAFEYFFITNSYPTSREIKNTALGSADGTKPFEILSLTDDLLTHLMADVNS